MRLSACDLLPLSFSPVKTLWRVELCPVGPGKAQIDAVAFSGISNKNVSNIIDNRKVKVIILLVKEPNNTM